MSVAPPEDRSGADDELLASLRLSMVSGIGPRIRQALLDQFGTPAEVLRATTSQLRQVHGVGTKLAAAIRAADQLDAETELRLCRENDLAIVPQEDPDYPRLLREIPDPPPLLFVRGKLLPSDALSVAIVGTRHATQYGKDQAERLAGSLSRAGLTIISGLARGIDGAAHRGTLAAGGRTIAVLASGLLNVFPPEHTGLADEIARQGAVISEVPPRFPPLSGSFPQRNRLITGMSLGTIVVEAADRSGALVSARLAMEQGREVFAVPGRVDNRTSRGCHRLIRDGARLVESADDVLEELGPLVEAIPRPDGRQTRHPAELTLNEQEQQVLDAIDGDPTNIDEVVVRCGLPIHRVLATISVLEMRHLLRRAGGHQVMRMP